MEPIAILRPIPGGVSIQVVASAGASVSGVKGIHGDALKVSVRAAPERGKANDEIVEVLSAFFGVSRKYICVEAGQASRKKRVEITGLDAKLAQSKIQAAFQETKNK